MGSRRTVAIVGYGAVGRSLHEIFPDAIIYDEPLAIGSRDDVGGADIVFVCVPTPSLADGHCDTSVVEQVVGWICSPLIVIRSTVALGTTERLARETGKRIVFQPEYGPGETPDHPFASPSSAGWVILGGERRDTVEVADLYKQAFNAELVIQQTTATTAELCKYMENAFLATKVAFCNEFYDIAEATSVDYNELRELWLLDPRMGRSHTFVYPDDRGFGGKCLPKDMRAIVASAAELLGGPPILLQSVVDSNAAIRNQ